MLREAFLRMTTSSCMGDTGRKALGLKSEGVRDSAFALIGIGGVEFDAMMNAQVAKTRVSKSYSCMDLN